MTKINEIKSQLPLKAIIPVLLISTLCIVSFAANSTVTTQTYKGFAGAVLTVSDDFDVLPVGFSVASEQILANTQWSIVDPVTNGVNAGKWMFTVKLTAHTTSTAQVSISWTHDGGITYEPIDYITITGPIVSGQEATFLFDTGSNTLEEPVGVMITVS